MFDLCCMALLDFIYLSQYSMHTVESLNTLDAALHRFHQEKDVFIELGIREHFNFPKLHGLAHYRRSITVFGTVDNYNTEQSERLHINFTKKAYCATNCKDEFKQMVTWVELQEAMHHCAVLIELCISSPMPIVTRMIQTGELLMQYTFDQKHIVSMELSIWGDSILHL